MYIFSDLDLITRVEAEENIHCDKLHSSSTVAGKTGLVERSSLIKHSSHKGNQEDMQRMQNAERSSTNSDNQAFLNDASIHKLI